jgi:hypothetical protein
MAKYKRNINGTYDDTENGILGIHEKSRLWHKVAKWLAEGNTPDPPDPEPDPPTVEEIIIQALNNKKHFKALVLALNDGSFIPGSNYTNSAIRDIFKNALNG